MNELDPETVTPAQFAAASVGEQDQVLAMLITDDESGTLHKSMFKIQPEADLLEYTRIAALGEPILTSLSSYSQAQILRTQLHIAHLQKYLEKPQTALREYISVVAFGELFFPELSPAAQVSVLRAMQYISTHKSTPEWAILFTVLVQTSPHPGSFEVGILSRVSTQQANRFFVSQITQRIHTAAATRWASNFACYPAKPEHPQQREQVLTLLQGLLASRMQPGTFTPTAKALMAVDSTAAEKALATLCREVANTLCKRKGWPSRIETIEHWFFTLASSATPSTSPTALQTEWEPDMAEVWRACGVERFFMVGDRVRMPYAWLDTKTNADNLRLLRAPLGEELLRDNTSPASWLRAWCKGDSSLARQVLVDGWRSLREQGQWQSAKDSAQPEQAAPGCWMTSLDSLSAWLKDWGAANPQQQAWTTLIYADTPTVLADTMQDWAQQTLTAATGPAERDQAINTVLQRLLAELGAAPLPGKLLQQLHRFTQAEIEAELAKTTPDATRLWVALEHTRLALGIASKPPHKQGSLLAFDETAASNLREAQQQAVKQAQNRHQKAQDGEAVLNPTEADIPIEPFATLGQEMHRLGHRLHAPLPSAAAAALQPGEHLVQLWWDANGQGQVLWLAHGVQEPGHPKLLHLPDALAATHWQNLLNAWKQVFDEKNAQLMAARIESAWQLTQRADSACWQLLQCLAGLVPEQTEAAQLVLVLPAEWARLPWLALLTCPPAGFTAPWQPGELQLAASVGAWLRGRTIPLAKTGATAGQVLLGADMSVGHSPAQMEAQQFAQVLGKKPVTAHGMLEVLRGLQATGHTHLILHGQYSAFDPRHSFLSVGTTQVPAWVLAQAPVQGDVSLASCESMLSGQGAGDAQYLGPVGLGAVLSAAGARSVMGPLWQAQDWASMLFHAQWLKARQGHTALQALALAQQTVRTMTAQQWLDWIKRYAPPLLKEAADYLEWTENQGWSTPFERPFCWAGYTLLGDAPALPALQNLAPIKTATTLGRWWAWLQRFWPPAFRQ